jgi:hypothetical protein
VSNEKNLIPNDARTPSERRENARKAGKASGAARRAKRTMREYADLLLSLPVSDRRKWNKLARAGIPPEGCDNKMLVVFALMQAAQAGDVPAVKELRNLIGEDDANASDSGQLEDLIKGLQEDE